MIDHIDIYDAFELIKNAIYIVCTLFKRLLCSCAAFLLNMYVLQCHQRRRMVKSENSSKVKLLLPSDIKWVRVS